MDRLVTISGAVFLATAVVAAPLPAQSSFAERLALTGKVWGYLKYHHTGTCRPEEAEPGRWWGGGGAAELSGRYWDSVLVDNVLSQASHDSDATFNVYLAELIAAAGVNEPPDGFLPTVQDIHRIPSSKAWMDAPLLSDLNHQSLYQVADEFRPFVNCHVNTDHNGVPDFSSDRFNPYVTEESERVGARLLGLFRFWNIVNYFYPYKSLIDEDWEEVLDRYVGRMLDVSDTTDYNLVMREFSTEVDDTHSGTVSPAITEFLGARFLPVRFELIEGRTIVTRTLDGVGLQPGDEVLSINAEDIDELRALHGRYVPASNPVARAWRVNWDLPRTNDESADLEVRRNGQIHTVTVHGAGQYPASLYSPPYATWQKHEFAQCSVGYVNMGTLEVADIAEMMGQLDDTDAIVFDIRNYPQGTLSTLVDYLFGDPIDIAQILVPRTRHPGTMAPRFVTIGTGTANPYSGRLMLLFNENTGSQAEYTVMGLEQHPGAVKIGSQTQAADGNLALFHLPEGIKTGMTALGVFYPEGTPTQRIGIVPDVYVTPTIEGIRNGVDEVLNVALDCDHVLDPNWPPEIRPASGAYYDPRRNGHGFDLSYVGDRLVLANYTFAEDGSPVWYLGTGSMNDGVFELDEGGYAAFSYDHLDRSASEHAVESAEFTLDFKSGQQQIECAIEDPSSRQFPASLDWSQNGSTVRWCPELLLAGDESPLRHIDGMWYAGEEDSGWGITVRLWGQVIFIVVYYYDQSGQPTWAIASGSVSADWPLDGPAVFELLEPAGYCATCAPRPLETRTIGTIEISLVDASRTPLEGNWVSIEAAPGGDDEPWIRSQVPLLILSDPP